jgi:hypothetical protein
LLQWHLQAALLQIWAKETSLNISNKLNKKKQEKAQTLIRKIQAQPNALNVIMTTTMMV